MRTGSATSQASGTSTEPGVPSRLIPLSEVSNLVSLQRSQIYDLIRRGEFPSSIKLGSSRRVAWIEAEILDWIDLQIKATRNGGNYGGNLPNGPPTQ